MLLKSDVYMVLMHLLCLEIDTTKEFPFYLQNQSKCFKMVFPYWKAPRLGCQVSKVWDSHIWGQSHALTPAFGFLTQSTGCEDKINSAKAWSVYWKHNRWQSNQCIPSPVPHLYIDPVTHTGYQATACYRIIPQCT